MPAVCYDKPRQRPGKDDCREGDFFVSYELRVTLIVLGLYFIAMLSGKIPYVLAAITGVLVLVLTGATDMSVAFSGFINKNVIMLAGMYAVASQFSRTGFITELKNRLLSGKGTKSGSALALTLLGVCAMLAQFMNSQSSILMLMMPFLMSLDDDGEITVSRLMLPMIYVMTGWMNKLPIGSGGLTTYLMLNQFIEAAGGTRMLDILSMFKCGLIPSVIVLLWGGLTCGWMPKKPVSLDGSGLNAKKSDQPPLTRREEVITYICFGVVLLSMLFQSKLGDRAFVIPLAAVIVMIYLRVCSGKWFLQTLINGPIIMMASVMGIAAALSDTGAGDLIGKTVLRLLGGDPSGTLICIVIGIASMVVTNFIGMTATFLTLCPIACSVCVAAGIDCRAAVLIAMNCCLVTVFTPMSSNGALIVYSTCGLTLRDTWKWAGPATLVGVACTIAMAILVYPPVA